MHGQKINKKLVNYQNYKNMHGPKNNKKILSRPFLFMYFPVDRLNSKVKFGSNTGKDISAFPF
jgi:hypothetical protein